MSKKILWNKQNVIWETVYVLKLYGFLNNNDKDIVYHIIAKKPNEQIQIDLKSYSDKNVWNERLITVVNIIIEIWFCKGFN